MCSFIGRITFKNYAFILEPFSLFPKWPWASWNFLICLNLEFQWLWKITEWAIERYCKGALMIRVWIDSWSKMGWNRTNCTVHTQHYKTSNTEEVTYLQEVILHDSSLTTTKGVWLQEYKGYIIKVSFHLRGQNTHDIARHQLRVKLFTHTRLVKGMQKLLGLHLLIYTCHLPLGRYVLTYHQGYID